MRFFAILVLEVLGIYFKDLQFQLQCITLWYTFFVVADYLLFSLLHDPTNHKDSKTEVNL